MPIKTHLVKNWRKISENLLLRRLLTVLSLDILVKASSILLLPFYLRLMTQEDYGIFNYISSIIYSFAVLLSLGLYIPQSKLFHDYRNPLKRGILFYNIQILLIASMLLIVLPAYVFKMDYYAVRYLFEKEINYERYRFMILIIMITSLLSFMLTNYFYTAEKISVANRYSLSRVIGINGISLAVLWFLKKEDAVALRLMTIAGVEAILLLFFYRVYFSEMISKISVAIIRKCFQMGLPYFLSTFFAIIINFGDKFFLQKYVDYTALSLYYLAFSCASVITLISNSLQNVWLPLFFKEKNLAANIARTKKMVFRLLVILIVLSVAIWVGVAVLLKLKIIPQSYSEILLIVPILLVAQIIVCIAMLFSNYMAYLDKTFMVLVAEFIVSITSVGLNVWLVPTYKIYGAAFTLLTANLIYLVVYLIMLKYYSRKAMQILPV